MSTSVVLLAVGEHLGGFELDEPVRVSVAVCPVGPMATVQLAGESLPDLSAELLAWADTLDNVTATVWRPAAPDGDLLHVELRGRLTDDTPVKIFGGLLDGPNVPGLAPGGRRTLSFAVLREWASAGAAVAA